jgi:hypothetical protein
MDLELTLFINKWESYFIQIIESLEESNIDFEHYASLVIFCLTIAKRFKSSKLREKAIKFWYLVVNTKIGVVYDNNVLVYLQCLIELAYVYQLFKPEEKLVSDFQKLRNEIKKYDHIISEIREPSILFPSGVQLAYGNVEDLTIEPGDNICILKQPDFFLKLTNQLIYSYFIHTLYSNIPNHGNCNLLHDINTVFLFVLQQDIVEIDPSTPKTHTEILHRIEPFQHFCFLVTHIVYSLTDYGQYNIMVKLPKLLRIVRNLLWILENDDILNKFTLKELEGEMRDCSVLLGDRRIRPGFEKSEINIDEYNEIYDKIHYPYCLIIGTLPIGEHDEVKEMNAILNLALEHFGGV